MRFLFVPAWLGRNRNRLLLALTIAAGATGASMVFAQAVPQATSARTPAAVQADQLFWQTFRTGDYAHIQASLDASTGAYLRNPNDAVTAAHVGWLHMWRVSERIRNQQVPPTITDDVVLARKYFQRAVDLAPDDARYRGFLASAILAEAQLDRDGTLSAHGAEVMQKSIADWPAFNLFTAGYVVSRLGPASDSFKKGLEQQWQNMDVCAQAKVDRHNPDMTNFAKRTTAATQGNRDARACLNSSIAPHNEEGFFLNMGDMLVKSGDWKTAQKIYAGARLSPDYAQWPYRDVLEQRIRDARANVAAFNAPEQPGTRPATPIMLTSAYACMACHQR